MSGWTGTDNTWNLGDDEETCIIDNQLADEAIGVDEIQSAKASNEAHNFFWWVQNGIMNARRRIIADCTNKEVHDVLPTIALTTLEARTAHEAKAIVRNNEQFKHCEQIARVLGLQINIYAQSANPDCLQFKYSILKIRSTGRRSPARSFFSEE